MNKTYDDAFSSYGIIKAVKEVNSDLFDSLFGSDFDDSLLDDYISFYNGDFVILNKIQDLFDSGRTGEQVAKAIARILILKYSENWTKLKATLAIDSNILNTYSTKITETNSGNTKFNGNNTQNNSNSVYGFNSEDSLKSDDTSNNSVTENNTDNNSTMERVESGYKNGDNITELKQKSIQFENLNKFFDIITYDIVKNICFTVY